MKLKEREENNCKWIDIAFHGYGKERKGPVRIFSVPL